MDQTVVRASIITPPGEGGIGIIAVTGSGAAQILDVVFVGTKRSAGRIPAGAIAHGTIRRGDAVLDEVILVRLRPEDAPTGEPYFEVNCHGGTVATQAVLQRLAEAGARVVAWRDLTCRAAAPAAPLSAATIRARALDRLTRAPTRLAAAMLLHQARGALVRELAAIAESLAGGACEQTEERLAALLRTARLGRALLRPPRAALLGPPNVGKSTLLNALLEEERVIVHHDPGTTRDIVAETVSLHGVPFELLDSAGIRRARDGVEKHAVNRAAELARTCDVALLVFDAREGIGQALDSMPALKEDADLILVGNKMDLLGGPAPRPGPPAGLASSAIVYVSAKEKTNLDQLESALLDPYHDLIEPCRQGGPVLFDAEDEEAVRQLRDLAAARQTDAALQMLQSLCAEE